MFSARPVFVLFTATLVTTLAGCTVGPDYVRPEVMAPNFFKESGTSPTTPLTPAQVQAEVKKWQPAEPMRAGTLPPSDVSRTAGDKTPASHIPAWWEIFNDAKLNELEMQAMRANQNIAVAVAQYDQAKALVQEARADYYPEVDFNGGGTLTHRGRSSGGVGVTTGTGGVGGGAVTTTGGNGRSKYSRNYQATLSASWEPDVWGRIRREVESSKASAAASADDLAAARLSVQAEVAQDYLTLRLTDVQTQVYADTVAVYQKALKITQNQYNAGVAARSDVLQAQVQLDNAVSQQQALAVTRAQYEHALAVLCGQAPAAFALAVVPVSQSTVIGAIPEVPAAIPALILQRRPDVASAERNMAAANAQIGVVQAAYYPTITLNGSAGLNSTELSHLFELPNLVWAVGPQISQIIFDGGLRRAEKKAARAAYRQTVATYRQTVLGAFQEVEDNLAAIRVYAQQAQTQATALADAQHLLQISNNQYQAGTISYLNVYTAQATVLSSQLSSLNIQQQRLTATLGLVQALGGGWPGSQYTQPSPKADGVTKQ